MNGNVKFFNNSKGFGFIVGDDGKDYFFHYSGIKEGVNVADNDAVTFDVEEGDRGLKAVNIGHADSSSSPEASEDDMSDDASDDAFEE
jgi:cold shock protein